MKKLPIFILLLALLLIVACGCEEPSAATQNNTPAITQPKISDESKAVTYFETLLEAVNADPDGTYATIKFGTAAYSALVEIEKLHDRNPSNTTIRQFYYYSQIISNIRIYNNPTLGSKPYYDAAVLFAQQIDPNYTGPFAEDVITLSKRYAGESFDSDTKTAFKMSSDEKADLKWWIEQRYDYYDSLTGKYSGDKYTDLIFQEAGYAYGIDVTNVTSIWSDYSIQAKQSHNAYRAENTDPNEEIIFSTDKDKEYTLIRVGVCPDWEPFQYYDEEGALVGFEIEFAKMLVEYNRCEIEFVIVEFDSLLPDLYKDRIDVAMSGMDLTDERATLYGHTDVYYQYDLGDYPEHIVAYTRKNDTQLINILNGAISAVKKTEAYELLKEKYELYALDGRFSD